MAKEIRGADVLLKVNGVAVAGQRDGSLSMQGDKLDTTTKTNGGWKSSLQGLKEWSMSLEAVNYFGEAAASQRILKQAFIKGQNIEVTMAFGDEEVYMGEASITSLNMSGPMSDISTASLTIEGAGPLAVEFSPSIESVSLNAGKTVATITFSSNISDNTEGSLKAGVKFASDGATFAALGASDSVAISGKTLAVTFNTALTGSASKIKIMAYTLKTANGAIQASDLTTNAISA